MLIPPITTICLYFVESFSAHGYLSITQSNPTLSPNQASFQPMFGAISQYEDFRDGRQKRRV